MIQHLLCEINLLSESPSSLSCLDSLITNALPSCLPTIHYDNQATLKLAKNPVFHAWTKHVKIHHHFIQERVLAGELQLHFVRTVHQIADLLTKALPPSQFAYHRDEMGIIDLSSLLVVT